MHIKDNICNFIYDKEYFINIYQNYLHVFNYEKIISLEKTQIIFLFANFKLIVIGEDFHVLKMLNKEILIKGNIKEIKFEK